MELFEALHVTRDGVLAARGDTLPDCQGPRCGVRSGGGGRVPPRSRSREQSLPSGRRLVRTGGSTADTHSAQPDTDSRYTLGVMWTLLYN